VSNSVTIDCPKCNLRLTITSETLSRMVVKVEEDCYVLPCPNPSCDNNIPMSIGEPKDVRI